MIPYQGMSGDHPAPTDGAALPKDRGLPVGYGTAARGPVIADPLTAWRLAPLSDHPDPESDRIGSDRA